jgi:hypothetical protein
MADDECEGPESWDEYQWERFLRQQDRDTEKYFRLLEKYDGHPQRDRIIAREMGWDFGEEEFDDEDWGAGLFCEMEEAEAGGMDTADEDFEAFVRSPVYSDTLRLHNWVNAWLNRHPEVRDDPGAIRMASRCAVCGAKIAAALCGDDGTEPGMTIAYLKRGLKAAHDALDSSAHLVAGGLMTPRQRAAFQTRLFRVRDRVVDLMRHYRSGLPDNRDPD